MHRTYKDKVEFFLVYIREAHPDSLLYTIKDGKKVLTKIEQTDSLVSRGENARVCLTTLKLSIPAVVDRADNKVNSAYAGWPDRLYVIDKDGKIAYQGGPGPGGFRPGEVEKWLRANVKP
jgi:type I thyroxine 5'-deiodinase